MEIETKASILAHAKANFPKECCGLLVVSRGKEIYKPCKNLSIHNNHFILDPKDYLDASKNGTVTAVVHSHCNEAPTASQGDLKSCEETSLPWHIVSLPNETWNYIEPTGYRAPYIGRQFVHGVLDCYSLIQDWYREERGIELPDFERDEEWWKHGGDLYMQNFSRAGFEQINDEMREGDVILMQIGSSVTNHGAIYLGNMIILQHLMNRLSSRDVYGGWYQKSTRIIVRHSG